MLRIRRTNATRLIVCEGYAEIELGNVVKDMYLPRGCGVSLALKNRRGSGGAAVLDLAIEMIASTAYDKYAVLVDTDQNWGQREKDLAATHGILTLECSPCLEAMLLSVHGHAISTDTAENKRRFERVYGGPAHRSGIIHRNFEKQQFDDARARVNAINAMLEFIRV